MLDDTEDRNQLVAGLLFVVVFSAVWAVTIYRGDALRGLVQASILAVAVAAVYLARRRYRERRQEVTEALDDRRYRMGELKGELREYARDAGVTGLVDRVDRGVEALGAAALAAAVGDPDDPPSGVRGRLLRLVGAVEDGGRARPPYGLDDAEP